MSSLVVRSALVFVLARYLSVRDMGTYGLLLATLGYGVYLVGFDFYAYATRTMLAAPRERWPTQLRSQLTFYGLGYLGSVPVSLLLCVAGLLPWTLLVWLLLLLPLEHLGQELDRLLVVLGRQTEASVCLFVRQALAPLLVVPLVALVPALRSIDAVLALWLLFDVVGVLGAANVVRREVAGSGWGTVDRGWIRRGIATSIPFLIGTLCLRALFAVDRQVLGALGGLEVLGAYAVFVAVGNGMSSLVTAGVYQFLYPTAVREATARNASGFRRAIRSLAVQTGVVLAAVAGVVLIALPWVLDFIGRQTYRDSAWMLPWILLSYALFNLSNVAHTVLYALERDRVILLTTLVAFAAFVTVLVVVAPSAPAPGVIGAVGAGCGVLLVGKTVCAVRAVRRTLAGWAS